MTVFSGSITLVEARLVAKGAFKLVYEHDNFPGMLIKILKPELIDEDGQRKYPPKWYKLRRRLGAFRLINREIGEFLAFQAKRSNRRARWPIAKLYGFVETEIGIGIVTERLADRDGHLAQTLFRLVKQGQFTPRHHEALTKLFQDLQDYHICLSDMHPGNIVFADDTQADGRFVIVDGLGARTLVPVRDWFPSLNASRIRRDSGKIWAFVDNGIWLPGGAGIARHGPGTVMGGPSKTER